MLAPLDVGRAREQHDDLAQAYRGYLQSHPDVDLADICYTANTGRSDLGRRAAVTGLGLLGDRAAVPILAKAVATHAAEGRYQDETTPRHSEAMYPANHDSPYVDRMMFAKCKKYANRVNFYLFYNINSL